MAQFIETMERLAFPEGNTTNANAKGRLPSLEGGPVKSVTPEVVETVPGSTYRLRVRRRLLHRTREIQRSNRHLEITRHRITSFHYVEHERNMRRYREPRKSFAAFLVRLPQGSNSSRVAAGRA